ncbi:MAG: hypothetical protein IH612_01510 [Desulfofustis sp.]|nr:hypothetical protein [Desulfofustis sp.]
MDTVQIVYANHRPESMAITERIMRRYQVIVLEEPPHPDFSAMLTGGVDLETYLLDHDLEYHDFSLQQCTVLQRLHQTGTTIHQVEPFLEQLLAIHEFFAAGHSPADLDRTTPRYQVYLREKEATKALIDYYQAVRSDHFPAILQALKSFARADVARLQLRDKLRAEHILTMLQPGRDIFIEAGPIHLLLERHLRRHLPAGWSLKTCFAEHQALARLGLRGSLYSPGDELTIGYLLRTSLSARREDLLCARALIFAKIITKEEMNGNANEFPHTRNEYETIRLVRPLTRNDCQELFFRTRALSTEEAAAVVRRHVAATPLLN